MPLGSGYTIEGQLNGEEVSCEITLFVLLYDTSICQQHIGGIQFDVFQKFISTVSFERLHGKLRTSLDMYKTPREHGLKEGDTIAMTAEPDR